MRQEAPSAWSDPWHFRRPAFPELLHLLWADARSSRSPPAPRNRGVLTEVLPWPGRCAPGREATVWSTGAAPARGVSVAFEAELALSTRTVTSPPERSFELEEPGYRRP